MNAPVHTFPRLLALDPSSTCTGWALFDHGQVIKAGKWQPPAAGLANVRISEMALELIDLLDVEKPTHVVIEDTTGKVAAGRHRGNGAGLSVYGKAIGVLWGILMQRFDVERVALIEENLWARRTPKVERQRRIALIHRNVYDAKADPNGDIADAIGLGQWFIDEQRVAGAVASGERR